MYVDMREESLSMRTSLGKAMCLKGEEENEVEDQRQNVNFTVGQVLMKVSLACAALSKACKARNRSILKSFKGATRH